MVLFLDGCSHYDVDQLAQKWTSKTDDGVTWDVLAEGRTDGCIKRTTTDSVDVDSPGVLLFSPSVTQAGPWTATDSGIFGAALKVENLQFLDQQPAAPFFSQARTQMLFQVQNGAWTMCGVCINNNGTFTLYGVKAVGGATPLLATSTVGLNSGQWAYLEFRWKIHETAGEFEIRANGTRIMNYTGPLFPDAFPFPDPTVAWSSIAWMGTQSTPDPPGFLIMRACDHYLIDREASPDSNNPNNDFLGDISIAYIKPNGVGAETAWTPSAGNNWDCVNEVPPNGDTDYVSASAAATKDTYAFEDVTSDPKAIQVCIYARKEDTGAASLAAITRPVSSDFNGPTQGIGSTDYDYLLWPQDVNPGTNVRWTQSQMNAAQWGQDKIV